jgi:phosphotransferase system HPr (HPr) family protein
MQTSPISRVVVVRNKQGLHARPADQFARLAAKFDAKVVLIRDSRRVPATSIIELLTLGATQGTQLTLEAEGSAAQEAVDALANLVENVFPREDEDTEHEERPGED